MVKLWWSHLEFEEYHRQNEKFFCGLIMLYQNQKLNIVLIYIAILEVDKIGKQVRAELAQAQPQLNLKLAF